MTHARERVSAGFRLINNGKVSDMSPNVVPFED